MDITAPIKPPTRRRRGSPMLRFLGFLFAAGMIVFVAGSAAVAYVLWHVSKDLPDYEVLARYEPPVMTRLHANDGSLIAEYAKERRIYVPISAVPDQVIKAFLAAEDKNFFQHGGLDIQGIMRAVVTNVNHLRQERRLVGASTITQQVAKNFLLSGAVTFDRKLREAILAIRIERAFTKEQILELYMNDIYLGLGAYGVAAAAQSYWGKSLNELTLSEAAYLAALPKAPNNYHPFRQTERAIGRRDWVLDRMIENGYITNAQGEAAKAEPLNVDPRPQGAHIFAAEFFAEEVRRQLYDIYGEDKLYGGGLSVRTTLDPKLQRVARRALVSGLVEFDRRKGWRGPVQKIELAGDWGPALAEIPILSDIEPWRLAVVLEVTQERAVVGLQPRPLASGRIEDRRETGEVPFDEMKWARPRDQRGRLGAAPRRASDVLSPGDVVHVAPVETEDGKIVEGKWSLMQIPEVDGGLVAMDPHTGRVLALAGGFSYAASEFNRAVQARRQPGSAFKPIIYLAALDNGYTPSSVVLDAPLAISQGPGLAVWRPRNYGGDFAGPSTLRVGIERSRNLMTVRLAQDMGMPLIGEYARRFGIYDDLPAFLSMSLGAGETTVLRMTAGYSMIANGGKQIRPTLIDRIQDRYGRTIYRHDARECADCRARAWQGQAEPPLPDDRRQIADPHSAYQMVSMLEGVVQRGTATRVKAVGKPLAGKTGTTNDFRDAWFVGFSPDLAMGVYIGYDNPAQMGQGETGGSVAAPVFRDFMMEALADKPAVPFRIPSGINMVRVNAKSGMQAEAGGGDTILEAFKPGTQLGGSHSVIGVAGDGSAFITPESERALTSGTGGLY